MPLTAAERSLRGAIAAHESCKQTEDRSARTAAARKALLDKFEREVDPNSELDPRERAKRAESARKAHYARMAFASAKARRTRAGRAE
jgi:hypothetical protein